MCCSSSSSAARTLPYDVARLVLPPGLGPGVAVTTTVGIGRRRCVAGRGVAVGLGGVRRVTEIVSTPEAVHCPPGSRARTHTCKTPGWVRACAGLPAPIA